MMPDAFYLPKDIKCVGHNKNFYTGNHTRNFDEYAISQQFYVIKGGGRS